MKEPEVSVVNGASRTGGLRWLKVCVLLTQVACLIVIAVSIAGTQWPWRRAHGWSSGSGSSALTAPASQWDMCKAFLGADFPHPFSVIMTADPGDFSGTPENHYILDQMKDKVQKSRNTTVCDAFWMGQLMGQPVLAVTTGIGPDASSMCTTEVVVMCGPFIKDIVYSGTSGWSPALGGILNPPNECTAANPGIPTRIGDTCVSPFSVDWTCKKATWNQQAVGYPNQCVAPEELFGPSANFLYGECQFYADNVVANLALADEVLAAGRMALQRGLMPARTAAIQKVDGEYWAAMSNATRLPYTLANAAAPPRLWNYTQCVEVDGRFFYSGAPWEITARQYAAEIITKATGRSVTQKDVVAVAAMEAVGVQEALLKAQRGVPAGGRKIPFTNIRAQSNWLHPSLTQTSPGVWAANEMVEDFVNGYAYAIAAGSTTVLSLFQMRCEAAVAAGTLPPSTQCSFTIAFPPPAAPPTSGRRRRALAHLQQQQQQHRKALAM